MNQSPNPPFNFKRLASRLKALRRKHRISLNTFGRKVGLSASRLARLGAILA